MPAAAPKRPKSASAPSAPKKPTSKSKTGNSACSQAASNWQLAIRGKATIEPDTYKTLAKCRGMLRTSKAADGRAAAGYNLSDQGAAAIKGRLQSRFDRDLVSDKSRAAKVKELLAQRAAKQAAPVAAKPAAATTETGSKRLEKLQASLLKKEANLDRRFDNHFSDVRSANGQPLNDKRNGASTVARWDRQSDGIRSEKAGIEKTKKAIQREQDLISNVASTEVHPVLKTALDNGEITQWRKYPNRFFVPGVDKGRIVFDEKNGTIGVAYLSDVSKEHYPKFRDAVNKITREMKATKQAAPVAKPAPAPAKFSRNGELAPGRGTGPRQVKAQRLIEIRKDRRSNTEVKANRQQAANLLTSLRSKGSQGKEIARNIRNEARTDHQYRDGQRHMLNWGPNGNAKAIMGRSERALSSANESYAYTQSNAKKYLTPTGRYSEKGAKGDSLRDIYISIGGKTPAEATVQRNSEMRSQAAAFLTQSRMIKQAGAPKAFFISKPEQFNGSGKNHLSTLRTAIAPKPAKQFKPVNLAPATPVSSPIRAPRDPEIVAKRSVIAKQMREDYRRESADVSGAEFQLNGPALRDTKSVPKVGYRQAVKDAESRIEERFQGWGGHLMDNKNQTWIRTQEAKSAGARQALRAAIAKRNAPDQAPSPQLSSNGELAPGRGTSERSAKAAQLRRYRQILPSVDGSATQPRLIQTGPTKTQHLVATVRSSNKYGLMRQRATANKERISENFGFQNITSSGDKRWENRDFRGRTLSDESRGKSAVKSRIDDLREKRADRPTDPTEARRSSPFGLRQIQERAASKAANAAYDVKPVAAAAPVPKAKPAPVQASTRKPMSRPLGQPERGSSERSSRVAPVMEARALNTLQREANRNAIPLLFKKQVPKGYTAEVFHNAEGALTPKLVKRVTGSTGIEKEKENKKNVYRVVSLSETHFGTLAGTGRDEKHATRMAKILDYMGRRAQRTTGGSDPMDAVTKNLVAGKRYRDLFAVSKRVDRRLVNTR